MKAKNLFHERYKTEARPTCMKERLADYLKVNTDMLRFLNVEVEDVLQDIALKTTRAFQDPASYELHDDVPQFFEMLKSDAWPWTETVVACTFLQSSSLTESFNVPIPQQLGITVLERTSRDTPVNKSSIVGIPCTNSDLFTKLRILAQDHNATEILFVARNINSSSGMSGSANAGVPFVLLKRHGDRDSRKLKGHGAEHVYFQDVSFLRNTYVGSKSLNVALGGPAIRVNSQQYAHHQQSAGTSRLST